MNKSTLKFPKGEFTHTMLAQHNGKTNQQVWTAYQQAIKDKIIVFVGNKPAEGGKGKPSKWWKLANEKDAQPAATPSGPVVVIPKASRPRREVVSTDSPAATEPVVEQRKIIVTKGDSGILGTDVPVGVWCPKWSDIYQIKQVCPLCKQPLSAWKLPNGKVRVQCLTPRDKCKSNENPNGVNYNENAAYHVLCEKFSHI